MSDKISSTGVVSLQQANSRAAAILARAQDLCVRHTQQVRCRESRVGVLMDATGSRQKHWGDTLRQTMNVFSILQAGEQSSEMKLVYYSGNRVYAGKWFSSAGQLIERSAGIRTECGNTQIEKSLRHFLNENDVKPVTSVVMIGDSCEENGDTLTSLASKFKQAGIKLFIFDDGERSSGRAPDTGEVFKSMAVAADGEYATFDPANMNVLSEYMKLVGAHASGSVDVIAKTLQTVRSDAAKRLGNRLLALPPSP